VKEDKVQAAITEAMNHPVLRDGRVWRIDHVGWMLYELYSNESYIKTFNSRRSARKHIIKWYSPMKKRKPSRRYQYAVEIYRAGV
jgi:hypothetical protein